MRNYKNFVNLGLFREFASTAKFRSSSTTKN